MDSGGRDFNACKIIDSTLIEVCQKKAPIASLLSILQEMKKIGVDIFEIDSQSLTHIVNSSYVSEGGRDEILNSIAFAYRFSENDENKFQCGYRVMQLLSQVKYVIVPVQKSWSIDSRILERYADFLKTMGMTGGGSEKKHNKVIVEIPADSFLELCKETTCGLIQSICNQVQATIIRIRGVHKSAIPFAKNYIPFLKERLNVEVDVCTSNDSYMATAIAIESIEQGSDYVSTHFNGGHDKKHAPFEEVVMARACLLNKCNSGRNDFSSLQKLAKTYKFLVQKNIDSIKPIIGDDIFKYESGIHADGIAKSHSTYEPYAPELVGKKRQLVLGKHSGSKSLLTKIKEWDIAITSAQASMILEEIRNTSIQHKSSICDKEILAIINNYYPQNCQ